MQILDQNESEIYDESLEANERAKRAKNTAKAIGKKLRKLEIKLEDRAPSGGETIFCFYCSKPFSRTNNHKRHLERGAW